MLGCTAACLLCSSAVARAAAPVTLGGLDPTPNDASSDCTYTQGIYVEAQSASSGSPASPYPSSNDVVPAGGGTITSWSVSNQLGGAQLRLAVVSFSAGAGAVSVDASSPVETIPGNQNYSGVVTFPVDIPVSPGEQIGLDVTNPPVYHGCVFSGPSDEQVDVADDGYDGNFDFARDSYFPSSQLSLEAALQPSSSATATGPATGSSSSPNGSTPSGSGSATTSHGSQGGLKLGHILQRSRRGGTLELLVPLTSLSPGRVSAILTSTEKHVVKRAASNLRHGRATIPIMFSAKALAALRRRHETRLLLTLTGPRGASLRRWITLL